MRAKNSMKNIKINLIFNLSTTILGFVSRTIFIMYLGENILGFNTLIVGIIGMLSVAELGIGTAVNYELYKPLVDQDYEKISEVMIIFKRLYSYIGVGIFILGLFVIPFLNDLTKGDVPYYQAIFYYLILLITTAGTYFFSYKQTLINADQKSYIVQNLLGISNIIKIFLQIVVMIIFRSYLGWLLISMIFTLGGNLYASNKVNVVYGNKVSFKSSENIKSIMKRNKRLTKNILNMFYHKFGEIVIYQTDPIVIAAFSSLKEIAMYANYTLILTALSTILYSVFNGITASVGNLIASETKEKVYEVFKEMRFMVNTIAIVISFSLFMSINQFISIWIGNKYLFNEVIVLLIIVNFYVTILRYVIGTFKGAYGIYWDIWAPVAEGLINLILSIGLSYKFGIIGVFIGTLASNVAIILIWQPYTVYQFGFKLSVIKYYCWLLGNMILFGGISFVLYELINKLNSMIFPTTNIFSFLFTGTTSFFSISIIIFILNCKNKNMKKLILRLKTMILKRVN